jgi:hypothetical protein
MEASDTTDDAKAPELPPIVPDGFKPQGIASR